MRDGIMEGLEAAPMFLLDLLQSHGLPTIVTAGGIMPVTIYVPPLADQMILVHLQPVSNM